MTAPLRRTAARRSVSVTLAVAGAVALAAAGCSSDDGGSSAAPDQVEARLLPPLADPGREARAADRAKVVIEGTVSPAAEGRSVTLQVRDGDAWTDLETGQQDADGAVEFSAPYLVDGEPQSYRLSAGKDARSEGLDTEVWSKKLAFDDEFDGSTLSDKWTHRVQGYGDVEVRSCSRSDPSMVTVGSGAAHMSVALDPSMSGRCTYEGQDYGYRTNANFGTEASFSFTYGYAAARMKFHEKRGQHAAFWMQPTVPPSTEGAETAGAEIDTIEWFGAHHPSGGLSCYVHSNDENGKRVKSGGWVQDPDQYGDDWWGKYHVFAVEWSPDGYVFRIDGQPACEVDEGVSGVPEFLILSNLSSNYELPFLPDESDLPQTTDVDWVRVWHP